MVEASIESRPVPNETSAGDWVQEQRRSRPRKPDPVEATLVRWLRRLRG
jgi:hypothetical protein